MRRGGKAEDERKYQLLLTVCELARRLSAVQWGVQFLGFVGGTKELFLILNREKAQVEHDNPKKSIYRLFL